ncbi:MAG: hypothetical protein Fur0037_29320 [Planctomycetota bacterium]
MKPTGHLTRCLAAGIVALLPIGGASITFVWLESAISSSWKDRLPFYFPGLGILLALAATYVVGLLVTTFLGRLLWRWIDRALARVPALGRLYDTVKEILGYDTTRERFFRGVVAVPTHGGVEVGLLTGNTVGADGRRLSVVFVPSAPNLTNGRLVLVEGDALQSLPWRVSDVLRGLVSLGKTPLSGGGTTT